LLKKHPNDNWLVICDLESVAALRNEGSRFEKLGLDVVEGKLGDQNLGMLGNGGASWLHLIMTSEKMIYITLRHMSSVSDLKTFIN
jgi:hypothetical protein